MSKGLKFYW